MDCPRCGTVNQAGATYCVHCGTSITDDATHDVPSPAQMQSTYDHQLPGFEAGVFPREHLIDGERIEWEGKPALIAYVIGSSIEVVVGLLMSIVFFSTDHGTSSVLGWVGVLLLIIGVTSIVIDYVRWKKTAFALTNRRVLTQYGVFTSKFADCHHDKIQNTVVIKPFLQNLLGYGELIFATAGIRGGIDSESAQKLMTNGGGVYWNALPRPAEVKRYTEVFIEASKEEAMKKGYHMMASVLNDKRYAPTGMATDVMSGDRSAIGNRSIEDRLDNVRALREKGAITQEEYLQMRKKILDEA